MPVSPPSRNLNRRPGDATMDAIEHSVKTYQETVGAGAKVAMDTFSGDSEFEKAARFMTGYTTGALFAGGPFNPIGAHATGVMWGAMASGGGPLFG